MPGIVEGQSRHRHRRGPRHRPRHRAADGGGGRQGRRQRRRRGARRLGRRRRPGAAGRRRDQEGRAARPSPRRSSIGEPANADKIVQAALDAFGRVDILVNNAGILRDKIFHRMSWSDWSDVIMVHLHGSFSMSRACATHFREQNSGSMIHMTSTSGLIGNFGQANYMAAKMGIVGLSRGIALDMQRFNVRSNAIAPFAWGRMIGSIPTETDAEKERVARLQQMTPEKIAPLVVYLGSDKAAGISGQIFSVRNNEIFLFNQTRPIRAIHRADGWTPDKLDAQLKGAFGPSFTPLDRSGDVFCLGPDLIGDDGHRLRQAARAENSRRRAHLHRQGHDALCARRRPRPRPARSEAARFRLREEPQGAADLRRRARLSRLLGARSRHRHRLGADRQRRAGRHRCTSRCKPRGHRARQDAHRRGDRQGRRQGRAGLHRAQGHRQGERRADRDRDADHVLPRRRRLRRPAAREPAGAQDSRARARSRLRSRHAAGAGADLSPVRRPQSAARRSRGRQGRGLSAADPARARHLRRGRPCASEKRLRLRSGARDVVRRALLRAGVSGRDHPHRNVARRRRRQLPRARCRSAMSW